MKNHLTPLRTHPFTRTGALLLGAWLCLPFAAQADDASARLERMERDIQTLSQAVYKGETPPQGLIAPAPAGASVGQTDARLDQMEQLIRDLTGKLEEQDFQLRQIKQQFEQMGLATDTRFQALEKGPGAAATLPQGGAATPLNNPAATAPDTATPPQPTAPAPAPIGTLSTDTASSDPATAYEAAYTILKTGDLPAAEKAFDGFLAANPDHALAGNARYWLGETHFARKDYQKSARLFAENYQKDPKGPKAADNLLKLGLSLSGLGNKGDACVALNQLAKDFPTAASSILTRAEAERSTLSCP